MCQLCNNKEKLGEICLSCHKQKIVEAKKEEANKIFEDIEKINKVHRFLDDYNKYYQELKKRHLSTFQKEKEHNNDFKKPCPECNGEGGFDLSNYNKASPCQFCKGQGFIKIKKKEGGNV